MFSNKYNELYISIKYEQQSLNNVFVVIQAYCIDDVNNEMYNHIHCIDVNQIMSVVHKPKPGDVLLSTRVLISKKKNWVINVILIIIDWGRYPKAAIMYCVSTVFSR